MRVDKTLSELWHLRSSDNEEASNTAFMAISTIKKLLEELSQVKAAYQDREDDIKSLEQLLRRVQRETSDYSTRVTIERALTITDK